LSLLAVAGLTLGLAPTLDDERALAEAPRTSAARISAVYKVNLGRFNLGNFRVTTTVQEGGYQLRGEGTFSVLEGLIFKWQGITSSRGRVTDEGPAPSSYAFNYSDGGKNSERLRITFGNGAVQQVSIVPKRRIPGLIPVRREQLVGVIDPMSGAFLTARSPNPNGDLSVCNQMLPVFDGRSRFDLVLKPKKRVMVQNRSRSSYSGPAAVCRVKFVPISGYRPDEPVRGTDMYVPYRIVLPTPVGYGTAVITSIKVSGARRASVD
jgi:hypothetical protein